MKPVVAVPSRRKQRMIIKLHLDRKQFASMAEWIEKVVDVTNGDKRFAKKALQQIMDEGSCSNMIIDVPSPEDGNPYPSQAVRLRGAKSVVLTDGRIFMDVELCVEDYIFAYRHEEKPTSWSGESDGMELYKMPHIMLSSLLDAAKMFPTKLTTATNPCADR